MHILDIGGSRKGLRGLQPPLSNFKEIKEKNKTKQKIEDNPLEKEEERKSYIFFMCTRVDTCINKHFPPHPPPPPFEQFLDPRLLDNVILCFWCKKENLIEFA